MSHLVDVVEKNIVEVFRTTCQHLRVYTGISQMPCELLAMGKFGTAWSFLMGLIGKELLVNSLIHFLMTSG